MGRSTLCSLITARPSSGLLFGILGVCVFSLILSGYYVHKNNLPLRPPDFISKVERAPQRHYHLSARTLTDGVGQERKAGILGSSNSHELVQSNIGLIKNDPIRDESLNNIDIALVIQNKISSGKKPAVYRAQREEPALQPNPLALRKTTKSPGQDMWPSRIKIQKKIHHMYQNSDPLYEKPNRTRENWNGERYIVYLCHNNLTCAGWGDRQHFILSAYLISLVTNRTLKVDFSNPCPLTKLFHPRIIDWRVEPSEFDGLSSTHVYAVNDRDFRELMKVIDFNKRFPQDVVYFTTNYDYYYSLRANPLYKQLFQKKVRGRPRPILFADLWQGIFKMNRRVTRRYATALKNARPTENHKFVCAHIRFGRNPTIPNDGDVRNTLSTIKPFWEFLKKYSDPSKYRLFVASDWEGFRQKVNAFYKEIIVNVEGDVIHIDKIQALIGAGNQTALESENLCNGLEKVVADQFLLSQCDILLLTYSVFGKSAAYMRRSNKDLYLMDKGKIQSLVLFQEKQKKH